MTYRDLDYRLASVVLDAVVAEVLEQLGELAWISPDGGRSRRYRDGRVGFGDLDAETVGDLLEEPREFDRLEGLSAGIDP